MLETKLIVDNFERDTSINCHQHSPFSNLLIFTAIFYKQSKDTVKIPLKLMRPQSYSDTGYRFSSNITAFYITIKE